MNESHNIEWKSAWHDDYLKWVCGFANAQGGRIYIGKDNTGQVTGLSDFQNLMDVLPNKIRDLLGIVCEVNLHQENGLHFIEIVTQPYSVPVSLRGRFYFRSGSSKMELTGNALNEFLLKKAGKTWDNVIETGSDLNDLDEISLQAFLKDAALSGRMPEESGLTIPDILDKLRLTDQGKLKRAAVILFAKDPNRFYPNVKVKIGRFGSDDADLKFQEEIEGNLIELLHKVPEQLNKKFLIRQIQFEGLQRIEKGEYPVAAIREMLLNALVHRTYMGAAIQMRVYDDKITLWNEGPLPAGMELASLKRTHSSRPRNLLIADICFKAGYIDLWGRGTLKILNSCIEAGLPEPDIQELDGGILVTLYKDKYSEEQLKKLDLNERQMRAVSYVKAQGKITNKEYQVMNAVSRNTASNDLANLVDKHVLTASEKKGAGSYFFLK